MLQIPFDVFGLDCFNVDAFFIYCWKRLCNLVLYYRYMNVFMPIRVFFVQLCDYKQSCLVFFHQYRSPFTKKKGAAFGVSNFEKICVTLIVNELI